MTLRIIAGKYKGRLLKAPKSSSTRPTQGMLREAVFNICQNEIEGARFLDLFAGSGAMGFEAISRGASHITLIESNSQALACIKANAAALDIEPQIFPVKAERAIQILTKQSSLFDIVYIDPPYDLPSQFLLDSLLPILAPHALIFFEERNTKTSPHIPPFLTLKDSRRFGIALLHQYCFSGREKS